MNALADAPRTADPDTLPTLAPELIASLATALRRRDQAALQRLRARLDAMALSAADEAWLGRIDHAQGDVAAAERRFLRLSEHAPLPLEDVLLLLWSARMLRHRAPLDRLLAGVSADEVMSLAPRDLALIARAADDLFEAGDRAAAARGYELARAAPGAADLVRAERLGAALTAAGRPAEALALLAARDRSAALGDEALVALAAAAHEAGDAAARAGALARLEEAGHASPDLYALRIGMAADAGEAIGPILAEAEARLPAGERIRLTIEAALAAHDADLAATMIETIAPAELDALGDQLGRIGYRLLRMPAPRLLAALAGAIDRLGATHPPLLLLAIEVAFTGQDLPAAAAAIARADKALRGKPAAKFAVKRAELAAFEGDIPRALGHLARLEPFETADRRHLLPVIAILAEAKDWPRLLALARTRLADWFEFSRHAAALSQAAVAEGAWADLLAAADRALAIAPGDGDIRRLRLLCRERMATPAELAQLLDGEDLAALPDHRTRIAAKVAALARIEGEPPASRPAADRETVIFYCADATYLAPAFTSLNSLLLANAPLLPEVALQLYVEAGDLTLSEAIAAGLRRRHGCALEIIPAADALGGHAGELRTRYGIFTGGRELAAAAYYRIFALERLRREPGRARALYLDSDTIVAGELSRIFGVLDGSAPLAARPEADKVDVRRVEARHGLTRGRYFNSGVLAADLRHPDLERALAGTFAAIGEPERLVYHDQCAINLGFRDAIRVLPDMYNAFCLSGDGLGAPGAPGVVLHFLDRPKPWQPGYEGPFGAFWYRYWAALAEVVDADAMRQLMARSPV